MKIRTRKKIAANSGKAPNPLRIDPSRTAGLRRGLVAELRRRFARLKGKIVKLIVDEDALGLKAAAHNPFAANAEHKFASTQLEVDDTDVLAWIKNVHESIDPDDVVELETKPHITVRYGLHDEPGMAESVAKLFAENGGVWVKIGRLSLFEKPDADVLKFDIESQQLESMNRRLGLLPNTQTYADYHPHLTIAYLKSGTGAKYVEWPNQLYGKAMWFDRLTFSDVDRNKQELVLTANKRWAFRSDPEKLKDFKAWLRTQIEGDITGATEEELLHKYAEAGFRKGAGRAFDDTKKKERALAIGKPEKLDFYAGTKDQFLRSAFGQPVAIEKVKLLATRSYEDLKGVTEQMSTTMGRTLADGMVEGKEPSEIARDLVEDVDGIGRQRAETIARTECLPGNTLVDSAVVRAVFRRWYEGPMIEVVTRHGRKFSATPNHPMLTRDGWIGAGLLKEGDNLVCHNRQQSTSFSGDVDVQRGPTTLREIFEALDTVAVLERERSTKPDFHGDGMEGEVDILRPDRELRVGSFATISKPLAEDVFTPAGLSSSRFCSLCGTLLSVNEQQCLCRGSAVDVPFLQSPLDSSATESEGRGKAYHRLAGKVTFCEVVNINVGSVLVADSSLLPGELLGFGVGAGNTSLLDDGTDPTVVPTLLNGNLAAGESGEVEFDDVLSVRVRQFAGHVYNLETPYGYYTIDSMYTGNTIRAHAEGQLHALKELGMDEVGVEVEWATSGLPVVCPDCAAMEGATFAIDEAHGLIPFHPNCMCVFLPSLGNTGVEEDDSEGEEEPAENAYLDLAGQFPEMARLQRMLANANPEGCNQFTGPGCGGGPQVDARGKVGESFKGEVHAVLKELPSRVTDALAKKGIKIVVGEDLVSTYPYLAGTHARGHATSDEPGATYYPSKKEVFIAEKRQFAGKQIPTDRVKDKLLEEVGHAFDHASGEGFNKDGSRNFASDSKAFQEAHEKDAAKLREDPGLAQQYRYLLQAGKAGRQEAFAAAFVDAHGGKWSSTSKGDLAKHLPNVAAHVNGLVEGTHNAAADQARDEQGRFASTGASDLKGHVGALYEKLYGENQPAMKERERGKLTKEHKAAVKELEQVGRTAHLTKPSGVPGGGTPEPSMSRTQAVSHITGALQASKGAKDNLVHLGDLHATSGLSRQAFEHALQEARKAGVVSLTPAEGRHGVSEHDRASGIYEVKPGSTDKALLLYASLRGQTRNYLEMPVCPKLLDVPNIPQPTDSSCGPAAAMSVARYFGVGPEDIEEWIEALGTTKKDGTRTAAIIDYLRLLGLRLEVIGDGPGADERREMTIEDLRRFISQGNPIIVPIQDYSDEDAAKFESGHYVVVIGVLDGFLVVQDPSAANVVEGSGSVQVPGRVLIAEKDFLDVFHDMDSDGSKYVRFGIAVGPG